MWKRRVTVAYLRVPSQDPALQIVVPLQLLPPALQCYCQEILLVLGAAANASSSQAILQIVGLVSSKQSYLQQTIYLSVIKQSPIPQQELNKWSSNIHYELSIEPQSNHPNQSPTPYLVSYVVLCTIGLNSLHYPIRLVFLSLFLVYDMHDISYGTFLVYLSILLCIRLNTWMRLAVKEPYSWYVLGYSDIIAPKM